MNAQERIARLESLLERVRRKAAAPRIRTAAAAPSRTPTDAAQRVEPAPSPAPPRVVEVPPSPEPPRVAAQPSPPLSRVAEAPPLPPREPIAIAPPMSSAASREVDVAPAEIEELDMMDADIVELGTEAAAAGVAEEFEEPAPESAPRPAAPALDALDLEPPVKTPPPESGRQAVTAPPGEEAGAELEAEAASNALEADLSGGAISISRPGGGPTMEQLGETVELEGADKPHEGLELAAPLQEVAEPAADDLELSLPRRESPPGAYAADLAAPPQATPEPVGRTRSAERKVEAEVAAPRSMELPSAVDASAETVRATGPIVVGRPATDGAHVAEYIVAKPGKTPETFLELLDGSLGLET